MFLLGLDKFIERYFYISTIRSPHVLKFISFTFKDMLSVGFYICLCHNRVGRPEIDAQICPGPPSTPPLPDVSILGVLDSVSVLPLLLNLLWQV